MAGGSAQHLAQRRHRRAEHADRGPLCARVRLRDLRWHRRDRRLGRDSAVKGWARPGGGRARIRTGCGWFGHGAFLWYVGSVAASSAAADWRPAGTLRRRMGGRAAASRRPAGPASAADGRGPRRAFIVSPPPPDQDPGPAASIRHRHDRPGRGIASVMGTDDHDDRADAHRSSGSPGKLAAAGGRCPEPDATLYQHRETSKFFPESDNLSR